MLWTYTLGLISVTCANFEATLFGLSPEVWASGTKDALRPTVRRVTFALRVICVTFEDFVSLLQSKKPRQWSFDTERCCEHYVEGHPFDGCEWTHAGFFLIDDDGLSTFVWTWTADHGKQWFVRQWNARAVVWGADNEFGKNMQPKRAFGTGAWPIGLIQVVHNWNLVKWKELSKVQCPLRINDPRLLTHEMIYYSIVDLMAPMFLNFPAQEWHVPLLDLNNQPILNDQNKVMTSPMIDGELCQAPNAITNSTWEHYYVPVPALAQVSIPSWGPVSAPKIKIISIEYCYIERQVSGGWVKKDIGGGDLCKRLVERSTSMKTENAHDLTSRSWSLDDFAEIKTGKYPSIKMGNRGSRLTVALNMPDGGCWWWALNCFLDMEKSGIERTHSISESLLANYCTVNKIPITSGPEMPSFGIWLVETGDGYHAIAFKPANWIRGTWKNIPLMTTRPKIPSTVTDKKVSAPSTVHTFFTWRKHIDVTVAALEVSHNWIKQDWESKFYEYYCVRNFETIDMDWQSMSSCTGVSKTFAQWWTRFMIKKNVSGFETEVAINPVALSENIIDRYLETDFLDEFLKTQQPYTESEQLRSDDGFSARVTIPFLIILMLSVPYYTTFLTWCSRLPFFDWILRPALGIQPLYFRFLRWARSLFLRILKTLIIQTLKIPIHIFRYLDFEIRFWIALWQRWSPYGTYITMLFAYGLYLVGYLPTVDRWWSSVNIESFFVNEIIYFRSMISKSTSAYALTTAVASALVQIGWVLLTEWTRPVIFCSSIIFASNKRQLISIYQFFANIPDRIEYFLELYRRATDPDSFIVKQVYIPCDVTKTCLDIIRKFPVQLTFIEKLVHLSIFSLDRLLHWLCRIVVLGLSQIGWTMSSGIWWFAELYSLCPSLFSILIIGAFIWDGWVLDLVRFTVFDCEIYSGVMRVPYPMKDVSLLLPLYTSREIANPEGKNSDNLGENKVYKYTPAGWDMTSQDLSGLSAHALSNLVQNGAGVSAADKTKTSQAHHGHHYLRKCSDMMRAKNEQLMMNMIKKSLKRSPDTPILMLNVGAKLGADTLRWQKMWGVQENSKIPNQEFPDIHAVHIRPDDSSAGNQSNWNHYSPSNGESTWITETMPNPKWTEGSNLPVELKFTKKYREDLFKGYLEDWIALHKYEFLKYLIIVSMNDCHYYFPKPLQHGIGFDHATLFISGLNFSPIPGVYKLPDNNGTYTVSAGMNGYLQIHMNPYQNGSGYDHGWVYVKEPVVSLNSGWIQHFATTIRWTAWQPLVLRNPPMETKNWYPQMDVLSNLKTSLAGDEWKKYFTNNDFGKFAEPIPYSKVTRWMLHHLTNGALLGNVQLLLRCFSLDTSNQRYLRIRRDWFRDQAVAIHFADSWHLDAVGAVRFKNFDEIGAVQVAGWTANNAPEWEVNWTSWKDYLSILRRSCKTPPAPLIRSPPTKTWTEKKVYYEVKPTSPDDIQPNRAFKTKGSPLLDCNWISHIQRYVQKMLDTVQPREVRATRHGPTLLGNSGEREAYEWCAKSPINLVYALFNRQMKSKLSPDPTVLKDFKKWFKTWFDSKFDKIDWEPKIMGWKDYLDSQTAWDAEKKAKYTETFVRQGSASTWKMADWAYAFSAMVKSGEVYFRLGTAVRDAWNCLLGRSDRPRLIFVPSKNACGPITWIQQFIFYDLKKVLPGFIQGLTCQAMKDIILSNKPIDAKCCSSDGSSFDSHQHYEIMEIVDSYVWNKFSSRMMKVLEDQKFKYPKVMHQGLMWQVLQHEATLFFQLPGIDQLEGSRWAKNQEVRNYFHVNGPDWRSVELRGTTFSGQPVKTTLGNTMRSLAYHEYLCFKAGIPDEKKFVIAAGDDVCCWISEPYVSAYEQAVAQYTHNSTDEVSKGLGQCIKELKISEWWDMDFCSKKCFYDGTTWKILRNATKIWTEKMEYIGSMNEFHQRPELHLIAMATGAHIELKSPLIDEFFVERIKRIQTKLQSNPELYLQGKPDVDRIDRINKWLKSRHQEEDLALWKKWLQSLKKTTWSDSEDQLPAEANEFFFTDAGWNYSSFIQYYGGSEMVTVV